jgi:hypothetical protein
MLLNGIYRLSAFKVGRRRYEYPTLTHDDLIGVRNAVLCGLGLDQRLKINSNEYISPSTRSSGIKT